MNSSADTAMVLERPSIWRRAAPALTLVVLAPVIGEVLTGATRLSFIFVLIPEMMVWGCGALLIRETVRRWDGGGMSMVLMGLALAVAEEWVIQQTSLSPFAWPGAMVSYGRLWGVNWIWFLIMLGYECVWVTLVPVQVTELLFRERRRERWLSNGGFVATGVVFLVGCFFAWFLWTHIARPKTFHVPVYQPPVGQLILGVGMIVALVLAAYALRRVGSDKAERWTLPVWPTCLAAVVLGVPWFGLMAFVFGGRASWPFWVPMILGCVLGLVAWALVAYWTGARGWDDMRRWALVFGATLASMACGFGGSGAWSKVDFVGKVVLNVLAVIGFLFLARRLRRGDGFAELA